MSELLKINVNANTEKKNGLTYLSWAWAWAEVLKVDPAAEWTPDTFPQADGTKLPCMFLPDGSAMVSVLVTIKGNRKGAILPVMDHRNKAIKNPDAFAINTAIQRCLAKAIAMHGLGLYIYAGEDLPEGEDAPAPKKTGVMADVLASLPPLSADDKLYFDELAADVQDVFKNSGASEAYERVEIEQLDQEQKLHLWSRLDSKVRSALKTEKGMRTAAA